MPSCANHPDILLDLQTCSRCGGSFCRDCVITLQGQQICAGCKGERVRDIASGVSDQADLASRGARLGAAIVDGLILMLPIVGLSLAFGTINVSNGEKAGLGAEILVQVLALGIATVYEAVMLKMRGQTLGKMAMKIAVVRPDGRPLTTGQCWGRSLTRGVLNATQIGGLIDALFIFSAKRATIHDRVSSTQVVNWKR